MKAEEAAQESKLNDYALSKLDKVIISAHAIFEGVGIAGLISAAFWYTTAPIAPDGFKGPISTYTIATTTIISLFLAVPIARMSYKKLIRDMGALYATLSLEMRKCVYSYYELLYELLKLRSSHDSDEQFLQHSQLFNLNWLETETLVTRVCQRFNQLGNTRFNLFWGKPIQLLEQTKEDSQTAISFAETLRDKEIAANPAIKSALIRFIKNQFAKPDDIILQSSDTIGPQRWSNVFYAIASGVACTEVLLSIGWTVISVLIGVDAILPIANWTWGIFAILCIVAGILFGVGMGLSRHKERKVQLIHLAYQEKHRALNAAIEQLHHLLTEHIFIKRGLITQS